MNKYTLISVALDHSQVKTIAVAGFVNLENPEAISGVNSLLNRLMCRNCHN